MKQNNKRMQTIYVYFWLLWGVVGCGSPTAAGLVVGNATSNPILAATAQADQYLRDAQATTHAQQAMLEANYRNVQHTAQAMEVTAEARVNS